MAGRGEAARLLRWYREHRRELPWRRTRDPYRILVSEIMLQQTRVETVLRYYDAFLERFADLASLAAAEVEEVLARWSGLGYYQRARRLHHAAREAHERFGALPCSARELASLPGIGAYTAAAVASIAFGERIPVLDGNVERVLARKLGLKTDPKRKPARQRLLSEAAALLEEQSPGDSNQALMELGALVCLPARPRCGQCPLRASCRAYRSGTPSVYPQRRPRKKPVKLHGLVVVARRDGRALLARRDAGAALMPGLWELPWIDLPGGHGIAREEAERRLAERYGGQWRLEGATALVRHAITFRSWRLQVQGARVELSAGEVRESAAQELAFFSDDELSELATGSLVRKCLTALGGERGR